MQNVGQVQITTHYGSDTRSYATNLRQISNMGKEVNNTTGSVGGLKSALKGLGGVIAGAFAVGAVVRFGKEASKSAMMVEASTQQINRIMGDSSDSFMQWANTQAIAYNMSKAQAIQYGSVYGNLISSFAKDTATATQYTTELLKASAVIASSTGRTMDDVMERIRSGMLGNTEAIEDLGVNVNVAMIESTNAFKKFANGKSWNQLDFQLQQQIRLFAILEQSTQKYGSEVNQNTNSSMQQLVAQLNNVKLSLGQAFLPIINIVIPILTRFAQKMAQVAELVNIFSNKIFGKKEDVKVQTQSAIAVSDKAEAVGDLGKELKKTGKEAKKAQGSMANFDDVIQLSKPVDTSASGVSGGGGSGVDSGIGDMLNGMESKLPAMESSFKGFSTKVNKWLNGIGIESSTVGKILGHAKSIKNSTKSLFSDLIPDARLLTGAVISSTKEIAVSTGNLALGIGEGLIGGIDKYLLGNKDRLKNTLSSIFTDASSVVGDTATLFSGLADLVTSFFKFETTKQAIADYLAIVVDMTLKVSELAYKFLSDVLGGLVKIFNENRAKLSEYASNVSGVLSNVLAVAKKMVQETFDTMLQAYDKYAKPAIENIATAVSMLVGKILDAYNKHILPTFQNITKEFGKFYETNLRPFITKIVEVVGKLVELATLVLTKFVAPIIGYLVDKLAPIVALVFKNMWETIKMVWTNVANIIGGVLTTLGGLTDFLIGVFTGDWKRAWGGIKDIVTGIFKTITSVIKGQINGILSMINMMINSLNTVKIDIPDWDILPNDIQGKKFGLSIPKIPMLADGGVATSPTLAMIAEAGDQEAVLPLNDSVMSRLASEIAKFLPRGNNSSAKEIHLHIQNLFGGDEMYLRELARTLNRYMKEEDNRVGGAGYVY